MNRLKANVVIGITDILMAVVTLMSPFMIVGSAFNESFTEFGTTGVEGQTDALANGLLIFGVISLALHIYGRIVSKKAGISTTGHILGIIAASLFAFIGAIMFIPSMVLYILAAIFTLKQKNMAIAK